MTTNTTGRNAELSDKLKTEHVSCVTLRFPSKHQLNNKPELTWPTVTRSVIFSF